MQLTFDTIEKAAAANLQIFENYARTFQQVLRTATDELVDVDDIPAGELTAMIYVVAGVKAGVTQTQSGMTTKWAEIQERADEAGTYFFQKPDDSLMTDVIYTSESEIGEGWIEDEAI